MWYDATVAASTLDAAGQPDRTARSASRRRRSTRPSPRAGCGAGRWPSRAPRRTSRAAWTVHGLGHLQAVHRLRRLEERLGRRSRPAPAPSTYQNPSYLAAAGDFATLTLQEINSVNVNQPGLWPAAGAGHPVRRYPRVRGLRPAGLGADHRRDRRPGVGRHGPAEEPVDRPASRCRRPATSSETARMRRGGVPAADAAAGARHRAPLTADRRIPSERTTALVNVIDSPPAVPQVAAAAARRPLARASWIRRVPLVPALVFMFIVTQIPFLLTLWYSFQRYNLNYPTAPQALSRPSITTSTSSATRSSGRPCSTPCCSPRCRSSSRSCSASASRCC